MWHWRSGAFDVVVWPLNNAFQLLHEKNASTTGWSHCLYRRRIMTIFISRVVQRKTCEKCASLNRAIINFSLAPHCCHTVCPFFLRTPLDTLNEMGWDENETNWLLCLMPVSIDSSIIMFDCCALDHFVLRRRTVVWQIWDFTGNYVS